MQGGGDALRVGPAGGRIPAPCTRVTFLGKVLLLLRYVKRLLDFNNAHFLCPITKAPDQMTRDDVNEKESIPDFLGVQGNPVGKTFPF